MNETLTFVASRQKTLLILLLSIIFVILGVWMSAGKPLIGWLTVGFFGLGILVALVMLLPNAMYLRLEEKGFEMGSLVRKYRFDWKDVVDFRIGSIHGVKMIEIIFHPDYQKQALGRAVASTLSGMEGAIPDQYNASLEQILEALKTWKRRSGESNS
jgi:hypothetical protein